MNYRRRLHCAVIYTGGCGTNRPGRSRAKTAGAQNLALPAAMSIGLRFPAIENKASGSRATIQAISRRSGRIVARPDMTRFRVASELAAIHSEREVGWGASSVTSE